MKRYILATLFALMLGSPAFASTVQTNLRIETATDTIYSGDVYLNEGCTVKDSEGKKHVFKKIVAVCALKTAATLGGFDFDLQNSAYGLYLTGIANEVGSGSDYWSFFVNYEAASVGLASYEVQNGDQIVLSLGGYPNTALELKLPSKEVRTGESMIVRVKANGAPVAGATVHVGQQTKTTNAYGKAKFVFSESSTGLTAYAEATGFTRSSNSTVRVVSKFTENLAVSEATKVSMTTLAASYLTTAIAGDDLVDQTGTLEWMAQALAAADVSNTDLLAVVLDYDPTVEEANAANNIARHILTLVALGQNPRNINGVDYVARLLETEKNNQFGYKAYVNDDVFAGLALLAAGESVESAAVQTALAAVLVGKNSDGGVSYAVDGDVSDVDTSAYYVQLLAAVGDTTTAKPVVRYLVQQQNLDGGWGYSNHDRSNSSSTSVAIQGLAAAGRIPETILRNHRNGYNFLARMQQTDGSFEYDTQGSFSFIPLNTAFSVMALTEAPLPIQ